MSQRRVCAYPAPSLSNGNLLNCKIGKQVVFVPFIRLPPQCARPKHCHAPASATQTSIALGHTPRRRVSGFHIHIHIHSRILILFLNPSASLPIQAHTSSFFPSLYPSLSLLLSPCLLHGPFSFSFKLSLCPNWAWHLETA